MRTTLHHLLLFALTGPGCVFAGQEGEEFDPTTETPGDGAMDADDDDLPTAGVDSAGREDTGSALTDPDTATTTETETDTDADNTGLPAGHTGGTGDTGTASGSGSDTGLPTQ